MIKVVNENNNDSKTYENIDILEYIGDKYDIFGEVFPNELTLFDYVYGAFDEFNKIVSFLDNPKTYKDIQSKTGCKISNINDGYDNPFPVCKTANLLNKIGNIVITNADKYNKLFIDNCKKLSIEQIDKATKNNSGIDAAIRLMVTYPDIFDLDSKDIKALKWLMSKLSLLIDYEFNDFLEEDEKLLRVWEYINTGGSEDITIPNGTEVIDDYSFNNYKKLKSVNIPDSVTSIGKYAFHGCENLSSITIPDSITSIGMYAFCDCENLTSITIPDSVTSIGDAAFNYCTSLTSITIPDSVTSIGRDVFEHCKSLTSVTIGNGITSIDKQTFYGCESLTTITIPDSVTSIDWGAFWWCKNLTSITIPDSVTSIDDIFLCCEDVTIKCHKGSYADEYAIENNIPVEYI